MIKVKINSCPCSGKTLFIRTWGWEYKGFNLYDYDEVKDISSKMLLDLQNDSCLLGDIEDPKYDEVIYLSVIISKNDLERNMFVRNYKYPNDYWCLEDNVISQYESLIEHTSRFRLPSFDSFGAALDYVREKM